MTIRTLFVLLFFYVSSLLGYGEPPVLWEQTFEVYDTETFRPSAVYPLEDRAIFVGETTTEESDEFGTDWLFVQMTEEESLYTMFGTEYDDKIFSVSRSWDDGFLICGNAGPGAYFAKLSAEGDYLWQELYDFRPDEQEVLYDIRETTDGGYITCGETNLNGEKSNTLIIKSKDEQAFGLLGVRDTGRSFFSRILLNDADEYIAFGEAYADGPDQEQLALKAEVFQEEQIMDQVWEIFIGGDSFTDVIFFDDRYYISGSSDDAGALSVINEEGIGGGEILAETPSILTSVAKKTTGDLVSVGTLLRNGSYQTIIAEFTPEAEFIDGYVLSDFQSNSKDRSVEICSDGGYLISGDIDSGGATAGHTYLVKTDKTGKVLWSKQTEVGFVPQSVPFAKEVSDGYLVGLMTSSEIRLVKLGGETSIDNWKMY